MDQYEDEQPIDLREYLAVIRARRFTVLLVMVLVTAVALGVSYSQEPQYTAQTRVLVQSTLPFGSTSIIPPQVNLETQREIATSEPVAALVIEDLETDRSVDSLLSGLSVEGVVETEVLRFSYTSTNPEFSRDAAASFAESYIRFRRQQEVEGIEATESAIQRRLETASNQLAEIEEDLQAAEDTADETLLATLQSQRNILIARLGVLQQRLDDIQAQRTVRLNSGQVIEEATLPRAPSAPNYTMNAILGGFLGLGLGVGFAFLRERLDNRFRGRADVERAIGAPVLATVAKFKQSKDDPLAGLVAGGRAQAIAGEAYRSLRTNVQFLANQRGVKSILVTSASAGEGKSVTAANLAVVLAQAGSRVIVVSADMRRPTIESYFRISRRGSRGGLSTWLLDQADPTPDISDPGIPNLRVVPCGPLPPNPAELLTSPRLRHLIEFLEANADFVIIDSPPVLAVADSSILATNVGGIVLVIDASKTHRSATIHATEELNRVGGELLGGVLNNFDWSASPYYYGPYTYYASEKDATPASSNGGGPLPDEDRRRGRKRRAFQRIRR